jgi:hypothetical protein
MRKHGWKVTEHLHLETAWEASFEHGQGGRVIGVNSEVRIPCSCIMFFTETVLYRWMHFRISDMLAAII